MRLDETYDGSLDQYILQQEAVWRERLLPELEWDEAEDSSVIEELLGSSGVRRGETL